MTSRYGGDCWSGRLCSRGGRIEPGQSIERAGAGWRHAGCPTIVDEQTVADAADRLAELYERATGRQSCVRMTRTARLIPIANFTIRPADETDAAVLSFDSSPDWGNFPDGTRLVSMHGSFEPDLRGYRQHRSWLAFGVVYPDGRLSIFRPFRALLDETPADHRDRHIAEKLRIAAKATRFLAQATGEQILGLVKAYAAETNRCMLCGKELKRERYQRMGVGPDCLKKLEAGFGIAAPADAGAA